MTKGQLIKNYNYNEGTIKYKKDLIFLTDTDNKFFKILLDNYNKLVKMETLCRRIYKDELDEKYRLSIAVAMSRLRNKIEKVADIQCKRSFGYRLTMKREKND